MRLAISFKNDNYIPDKKLVDEELLEIEVIRRLDSPEYSSDTNPIANVWNFFGRRLTKHRQ